MRRLTAFLAALLILAALAVSAFAADGSASDNISLFGVAHNHPSDWTLTSLATPSFAFVLGDDYGVPLTLKTFFQSVSVVSGDLRIPVYITVNGTYTTPTGSVIAPVFTTYNPFFLLPLLFLALLVVKVLSVLGGVILGR